MPADPGPDRPSEDPGAGLVDPRAIHPGPELDEPAIVEPVEPERDDAPAPPNPSRDTPEECNGPGLVDPRPDLPTPEDLAP